MVPAHRCRLISACLTAAFLLAVAPLAAAEKSDFLTSNIDASVKPGDNFFQYSNGAWLKRNPIPPTESAWGVGSVVREQLYAELRAIHERSAAASGPPGSDEQKIGDFWRAALDVDKARALGIQPLQRELQKIEAAGNLDQVLGVAFEMQALGAQPFFAFFIGQDLRQSDVYAAFVWQGGLGLPDREFYLKDDKEFRVIRAAYVRYLAGMLTLLGRKDANSAAVAVMRFEAKLAEASRKTEDLRDPLQNYTRIGPSELTERQTPSIKWAAQFEAWSLRPSFVAVGQPEYLAAMDRILQQTPIPVLKDYLRLTLVTAYAPYLSPAFEDAHFAFYKGVLSGQKAQKPRWKRVIDTELGFGPVPESLGMIVGRRWAEVDFPGRTKQRYVDMTRAILGAYRERIQRLDWMSSATKERALAKLDKVTAKVGYPDRWSDTSALAISRSSYCENMLSISRWYFERSVERFSKPVDRGEWRMSPQTWNAYYSASDNQIVLPAAVFLIPGVADDQVDDAVAFGYGGASTIGHEITHGFDDQGRKFDATGNLTDWWTAEDAAAFERKAAVIVSQFNAFEPLPGMRVNGKLTLGENIADLGGLAIALDAFKKTEQYKGNVKINGYTPLQRFFLGYSMGWMFQVRDAEARKRLLSDEHAPSRYRVLGPVSNVAEFYEAFDVTPKNKMWRPPEERARVW